MQVVHQDEQRPPGTEIGHEAEHCGGDQEPVRLSRLDEAEPPPQRDGLRLGQPVETAEHGMERLMEAGESELRFRLDSARTENLHSIRVLGRVREE